MHSSRSLLWLNVCRLCVPNIISLCTCLKRNALKKLHLVKVDAFAWYGIKIHGFFFKTQRIKVYTWDNLDPGPRCSPWQCVRACYSCSNARAPRDNHAQNGRLSCTWNSVLRRTKANSKIIKPTSSLTKNMSHCYSIKATYTYIIDTEKWYRKWPITIKLLLRWFKHKLRKTTKPNTAGY